MAARRCGERALQPCLVIVGGQATIGASSSRLHPDRTVGECAGAGHQEVRLVEQLDVLDVAVDPAVVEQQVELADLRISASTSDSLMSQPGCSSSSRRTTGGRITLDTLWKVPMSIRPLPALKRSTASASASAFGADRGRGPGPPRRAG